MAQGRPERMARDPAPGGGQTRHYEQRHRPGPTTLLDLHLQVRYPRLLQAVHCPALCTRRPSSNQVKGDLRDDPSRSRTMAAIIAKPDLDTHVTTIVKPTDIELHEYRVQNIVDPKIQQGVDRIG